MEITTYYTAKGLVYGNLWGGGKGSYPSETLRAKTKEDLEKQIEKGIKDGSLDSGMGYESLIGAIMDITTHKILIVENDDYHHEESETCFYGELNDDEINFLEEQILYM